MIPVQFHFSGIEWAKTGIPIGQELHVTVIRGASNGGFALLRTGKTTIRARVEGEAIRDGERLSLRVEKDQGGRIRLLQLSRPNPLIQMGELPRSALLPFFRFLSGKKKGGLFQRTSSESSSFPSSLTGRLPESLKFAASILDRLVDEKVVFDYSIEIVFPETDEKTETFLSQWNGGPLPLDTADSLPAKITVGGYKSGELLSYFMTEFEFAELGRIALLITSPDREFRNITVLLCAQKSDTEIRIEEKKETIGRLLNQNGIRMKEFAVLSRNRIDDSNLDLMA